MQLLSLTSTSIAVGLWSWRQGVQLSSVLCPALLSFNSVLSSGESRDKKMLCGITFAVLAEFYYIRQSSRASCSQHLLLWQLLCCPRNRTAGTVVMPAVRLALTKEASVWIWLPWRQGNEKALLAEACSQSQACTGGSIGLLPSNTNTPGELVQNRSLNWDYDSTAQKLPSCRQLQ